MPDGIPGGSMTHEQESRILRRELERRIDELERTDDREFGRFTALDWTICVLFFVVLPILAAWWFA